MKQGRNGCEGEGVDVWMVSSSGFRVLCNPGSVLLTFSIIAETHFGLSKTNGILSLADAIKFFQLSLVDALAILVSRVTPCKFWRRYLGREASETDLARKVDFNGLDANVLRPRCHCGC